MSDFPNFLTYSQISRFLHHCLCYCLPIQQLYPHELHLYPLHLLINSTILFWMTSYNAEEQGEHPNDFSAASCTPQPSMLQTTLGFLHLSAHQAAEGSAQPYGPISNAILRFRTRKTHISFAFDTFCQPAQDQTCFFFLSLLQGNVFVWAAFSCCD